MRFSSLSRLLLAISLLALTCVASLAQELSVEAASKALPDRVGDFRAQGAAYKPSKGGIFERAAPESFDAISEANRSYVSPDGVFVGVTIIQTRSDAAAYSLLTYDTQDAKAGCEFGAACLKAEGRIAFSKGPTFVDISSQTKPAGQPALLNFARVISEALDAGAGGVPPLVLHLPDWEKVQEWTDYAVSLPTLQDVAGRRPVLDALSFEGGAEAVTTTYGASRLVVVEFTTPQYATDNDARITQRIVELRAENQPVPNSYRREGNYAVFVFDAPDEAAAVALIDQVKYEKDIRWLGNNPHEQAFREKYYTVTMGGVVLTSLKITGLAILLCLGIGGIFGGAIFLRRRMRIADKEVYSDAGGMVRLNIEELNSTADAPKLIGEGRKG